MSDLQEILTVISQFNRERDWEQFHNTKDLAVAINIEAGELLEQFLWKEAGTENVEKVKEELADVIAFCLLMASKYDLDVKKIVLDKIASNNIKYPINKAKGSAKKYDEL